MASNEDIGFFATGFRNPFDVIIGGATTLVYAQDNGSNEGFGAYVDGYNKTTQLPIIHGDDEDGGLEVDMGDELNLIVEGDWYGQPNVARYRADNVKYSHE